jgi:hypothetical protein
MRSGPIVIGYDGSPAAEHAVAEAGDLLNGRLALVVVVWNQGLGFELLELPTATIGLPPARPRPRGRGDPQQHHPRRRPSRTLSGAGGA